MAVIATTGTGRLSKYTSSLLGVFEDSMINGTMLEFTTSNKTKKYVIKDSVDNKTTIEKYTKLSSTQSTESKAKNLFLESKDGHMVRIGNLEKKHVKADSFNRGDVSEGLLAAAITARFTNKNRNIDSQDVIKVLKSLKSTDNKRVDMTFPSPNDNPAIIDDVRCHISLAQLNMTALLNPANYGGLSDLIKASVEYANGPYITKWSKLMYENNVYNHIEVDSDGLLDQKGTKVDLRVKIDGKLTDVNVSLKAGDVKQFGQVSGSKFENMVALFDPLGIELERSTQLQEKFNGFLKKKDTVGACTAVYEFVKDSLNRQASQTRSTIIKTLSDFITFHATRNEENVTLVQLNRSEAKVYDFDKLFTALADVDLGVDIKYGNSNVANAPVPTIRFFDKSDKTRKNDLLTIRMKIDSRPDGFYHRNYIEKGPAMTKRISS